MTIFAENAPLYWAAGLPAIPLRPNQKRPAINGWQIYADQQPSPEEKSAWLHVYANGNIGLPMGAASGLVAVDIDTDEPKVLALLDRILPPTPWRRVGKKGEVRIYRYFGEKTTRIQTKEAMICEILSKGTQIVLPPSIHPDTGKPYVANAPLYEILALVPTLVPGTDDMIRDGLRELGYEIGGANQTSVVSFVPAGQRDNAMTAHAGILARAVTRGERTLMEAIGEMEHWVENYVEQVVGDPIDPKRAAAKVVHFVLRDVNGPRKIALPHGWDMGLTDEDKKTLGMSITEEDEKWTATRILDALADSIREDPDPTSEGFLKAVDQALMRVVRAGDDISVLDQERIFKFIVSQSAGTITLGAIRKQIGTMRVGDIEGTNHDEIAKEVLKYMAEFGEVRFHVGKFWRWVGSHWREMDDAEILQVISGEFGDLPACKKHSDYKGVLTLLRSLAAKPLQQMSLTGVNFANGFLDQGMQMHHHHPDFGATYVLPYRYVPEEAGKMPMFDKYLLDSWGHDNDYNEKRLMLQEMMGATMFAAATEYQRAFLLYGVAGSGKSVMSEMMAGLLPKDATSYVDPDKWSDTFLPAEMFGKVMNAAGELSETRKIAGDVFKRVVEGTSMTAQRKNQQPFKFSPTCAQWLSSNFLPLSADTSQGFIRRWLIVEWNKAIKPEDRIPGLAQKILLAEREVIAAWAVEGFVRLKERGRYTMARSHRELVETMAAKLNPVRAFLKYATKANIHAPTLSFLDVYDEYIRFNLGKGSGKKKDESTFLHMIRELASEFGLQLIGAENPAVGWREVKVAGIELID